MKLKDLTSLNKICEKKTKELSHNNLLENRNPTTIYWKIEIPTLYMTHNKDFKIV